MQGRIDGAEYFDQLLVNDPHQFFVRSEAEQNPLAECLFGHVCHEFLHDTVADVRFEQRLFDDFQAVAHIALGQFAFTRQTFESGLQAFGEGIEHGRRVRKDGKVNGKPDSLRIVEGFCKWTADISGKLRS